MPISGRAKVTGRKKRPAIFIDRDGVIDQMVLYESGYDSAQSAADVKLVAGVAEVIAWANSRNLLVVEISNQPGVAKGKMSQETADEIEKRTHQLLAEGGGRVDKVYICPHHPRGVVPELTVECDCRKPKPGLILKAVQELAIDIPNSIFLGDKASDCEAARVAGCKSLVYIHEMDMPEKVAEAKKTAADYRAQSMGEVVKILKEWMV